MRNKHPEKKKYITLRNNEGKLMHINGDLTIEDLVKLGIKNISIVEANDPMNDTAWTTSTIREDLSRFPDPKRKEPDFIIDKK